MFVKIVESLFLSDFVTVNAAKTLPHFERFNITDVLTVSTYRIHANSRLPHVNYHYQMIYDTLTQRLLTNQLLERCLTTIEKSIANGGNIVVHCEAGISRSVTIIMAYLMKTYEWTVEEAFKYVVKLRPVAQPNVNFLNQLKIFEKCHYKTDSITLSKCVEAINIPNQVGCYINCLEYPVFSKNESRIEEGIYRCRKCRQALFFNQHIVKHASLNEQKDSLGEKNSACKLRYIVEPLKWMALDAVSGNIRCYKCGEKLGDFNWAGKFCNITYEHGCGAFVVPWVFINEKKVDLCTVSSNSNIILPIIPVCSDSNERYNSPEDSRSFNSFTVKRTSADC